MVAPMRLESPKSPKRGEDKMTSRKRPDTRAIHMANRVLLSEIIAVTGAMNGLPRA
jgi:hypothetical protein